MSIDSPQARAPDPRVSGLAVMPAVIAIVLAALVSWGLAPVAARASPTTKQVAYRGVRIRVPAAWPVFRLDRDPATCVRFNRHAVYLGRPGAVQDCPPVAIGRTEAILISPGAGTSLPDPGSDALIHRAGHVTITATWHAHPNVIRAALGAAASSTAGASSFSARERANIIALRRRGTAALTGGAGVRSAATPSDTGTTGVGGSTGGVGAAPVVGTPLGVTGVTGPVASVPGSPTIDTGLGFDACDDPSPAALTAWLASPYRAVGTYIGGTNMGCSQPNLTAAYVSDEVALGWHLIPTYVGLQAPSNSCSCAAITPSKAAAQGAAAAEDAVTDAQAVGIGPGNPIYFDMEAYPRRPSISQTVLTFLSAWTTELHALGYRSGTYSSTDSGIEDLVAAVGTAYVVPDNIWDAEWNGRQNTTSAAIPSTDWADHQRLHQYQGAHDETYGKVKLSIDSDYLDGATVGAGSAIVSSTPTPALTIAPEANGAIKLEGSWSGAGDVASWKLLGGSQPTTLGSLGGPMSSGVVVSHSAFPYFAEQAFDASGSLLGSTPVTATPSHLALYGRSLFAPQTGWIGLPVGCFTGTTCHLTTTVTSGQTVLARTKPERAPDDGSGIVYFALSAAGHKLLAGASGGHLPVTVTVTDASGARVTGAFNLVSFKTTGHGPARSATQGVTIRFAGLTDFVAGGGYGGILAECVGPAPCAATATLTSGGTTVAQTGSEFMGANELSYLSFKLTAQGRTLLAHAPGNQLATQARLTSGSDSATAAIALVHF